MKKSVKTFTATIYCGSYNKDSGTTASCKDAEAFIQQYVNELGLCVTITQTRFVYTDGVEDGIAVGIINYPRFPSNKRAIKKLALDLAERLRILMRQWRVSIVFPDVTVMLGD